MPEVTDYPHGVPSWIDLATPDLQVARQFYADLFGWEYDERPTDDDAFTYTMASKSGKPVAGMMVLNPEMAASGMPPVWSSYVTVVDLDAAVAEVEPAGGSVMSPPMDVMDAGRMAVVTDSTGAVICLWQKRNHIGAGLVKEPGTLTWNELVTTDTAKAAAFYADVLGWSAEVVPMGDDAYTIFRVAGGNEQGIAGAMQRALDGMPAFWNVYFAVADTDVTVAAAVERGATVLAAPMDIPGVGRMAALVDPTGATFSLMANFAE